jgi:hypothetical protein
MRARAVHIGFKFSLPKGAHDICTVFRKKCLLKTANSKINSMPGMKEKFHICFSTVLWWQWLTGSYSQLCIIPKQGGKCEDMWKSFHSSNSLKGSYPYTCHKGNNAVEV